MRLSVRTSVAVLVACTLLLAGCGRKENAVRFVADGAYMVVENRSGEDIYYVIGSVPATPFIPIVSPDTRLENGRMKRLRVPPSRRGEAVELAWWFKGKEKRDGVELGDRIRRIPMTLAALAEPLPRDEVYVLACIEMRAIVFEYQRDDSSRYARDAARGYDPRRAEAECMKEAEEKCVMTRADCENSLAGIVARTKEIGGIVESRRR
jgi:hypothetical protein